MGWADMETLVNRTVAATFPTTVGYRDKNGVTVTFTGVFDEAFQMIETGTDGVSVVTTHPIVTCQVTDFGASTAESDGVVTINGRVFVVDSVNRLGHQDVRLTMQERD